MYFGSKYLLYHSIVLAFDPKFGLSTFPQMSGSVNEINNTEYQFFCFDRHI
ncbi:hypothetical protein PROPEN_02408 [Proteus penneri ATCC 35198]|nr:hypothetical protein PROPEN_02408 [Proteus penneri ATCC 35198]